LLSKRIKHSFQRPAEMKCQVKKSTFSETVRSKLTASVMASKGFHVLCSRHESPD
jgi:hypothetical protein